MTRPIKKAGFKQGIYEISATRKERIGTLRITQDGRKFRYAKAGSNALAAGKVSVAADISSDVVNKNPAAAAAIGATQVTVTIGSSTIAENYFQGGYLQVNDSTGEGLQYEIDGSSAVSSGTSITISLCDPIMVALTTSSEVTLVHSPYMATIESADEENMPAGIPPVAVTAAYYYWAQTGGMAVALQNAAAAVHSMLTLGATAGSVAAINSSLDVDQPIFAQMGSTVGVTGEYKPIRLFID